MGTEGIDYALVLSDMRGKRAALDVAIANLEVALGQTSTSGGSNPNGMVLSNAFGTGEVPAGAFLSKSIPDAAILYLKIVKRKSSTQEIADALKRGGMESTSVNFTGIVRAVLDRSRKSGGEIVKLDSSMWGLAEWYPAGVKFAIQEKKTKTKRKAGKAAKAKAKPRESERKVSQPRLPIDTEVTASSSAPTIQMPGQKPQQLVEAYFADHPTELIHAQALAKTLGLSLGAVNLVCSKLKHRGRIEKTANGYRATKATDVPLAV